MVFFLLNNSDRTTPICQSLKRSWDDRLVESSSPQDGTLHIFNNRATPFAPGRPCVQPHILMHLSFFSHKMSGLHSPIRLPKDAELRRLFYLLFQNPVETVLESLPCYGSSRTDKEPCVMSPLSSNSSLFDPPQCYPIVILPPTRETVPPLTSPHTACPGGQIGSQIFSYFLCIMVLIPLSFN